MPHRRRILFVEDDDDLRYSVTRCFVLSGWEVLGARDIAEARAFLPTRGGDFAAALIDLSLPDGPGEDIIGELKALPRVPRVVVYTACGEGRRIRKALAGGADSVALKPARFVEVILPLVLGESPSGYDPGMVIFADPPPPG